MSEPFDVQSLAHEVAAAFQTDYSDYGHGQAQDGADALLTLIRAVVRQEVEAHALKSREVAEEHSQAEATRFHLLEEAKNRCEATNDNSDRCTLRRWHVETVSNRAHRY